MVQYIGIDPGMGGGIAFIDSDDNSFAFNCPPNPREMSYLLKDMLMDNVEHECIIEHVHAFPHDGRSSVFKFGRNLGQWEGVLCSLEVSYITVTPYVWQKYYGTPKFEEKAKRKRWLKALASEKFPQIKTTFKVSDAVLIANYLKETSNAKS